MLKCLKCANFDNENHVTIRNSNCQLLIEAGKFQRKHDVIFKVIAIIEKDQMVCSK